MQYWIARNNQKLGPYSLADVQSMMADGKLVATDLGWTQGMASWGPVFDVIPAPQPPKAEPPSGPEGLAPTRMVPIYRPGADGEAQGTPQPAAQPFQPVQPHGQSSPAPSQSSSAPTQQFQAPAQEQPFSAPIAREQPRPAAADPAPSHASGPAQGGSAYQGAQSGPPAAQPYSPEPQPYQPAPAAQPFQPAPAAQPFHAAPAAQPYQAPPAAQPYQAPPAAQPYQQGPPAAQPYQPAQPYPGPANPGQFQPQPPPGQAFQQPGQPYPAQPYAGAVPAGGAVPPGMHWALVLVLGSITFGIFYIVWILKELNFIKRIDPQNNSGKLILLALAVVAGFFVLVLGAVLTRSEALLAIVGALGSLVNLGVFALLMIAYFKMRTSLLNYYNTVEPIGLRLSGAMTFFFNILYFQYHFHRIAEWKRTGVLTPQK